MINYERGCKAWQLYCKFYLLYGYLDCLQMFLDYVQPSFYLFKNNYKHLNRCSRPVGVLFSKANTQQYVVCTERRYSVKEMYQDYISNCLTDRHSSNKISEIFNNTIGVYSYRIRQNFYPVFWLTAPVNALNSVNVHPNTILSVLINILFWVINFSAGYFLEKFLDNNLPTNLLSIFDKLI